MQKERGPARVMLVDDEPTLLAMMHRYLTRRGFEVEAFDTAEAAWARVDTGIDRPHFAVIDINLHGMGGEELSRKILDRSPTSKVVISSGTPFDVAALDDERRTRFLLKPFTPELLAGILQDLMEDP